MLVTNDIILIASRRLQAASGMAITPDIEIDIAAQMQSALAALAKMTMANDAKRGLLQQDYTIALTAGIGNLITATGAITTAADMLMDGVYWGVVIDADGDILQPLKNYSAFLKPQPLIYSYYCLRGERIHTRSRFQQVNYPSDVTSVTGPLTITANFEPATCEVVPNELGDDLIECLVNLVLTKMPETLAAKK